MRQYKNQITNALTIAALALLTGCGGVDSSITALVSPITALPPIAQTRVDFDFIPGEIVTTTSGTPGYQIKASIGEISEKQTTSNLWKVEGVFYR